MQPPVNKVSAVDYRAIIYHEASGNAQSYLFSRSLPLPLDGDSSIE